MKRHLQVKVVKDSKQSPSDEVRESSWTPEKISSIIKDHTKQIAIIAGVGIAALKVLETVNEIAVITADRKIK